MRPKICFMVVSKEKVLIDFEKICEQVGPLGLLEIKQDSPLVQAVDHVLQHGLRDPVRGYWSLVRSLTHSTTLKSLEAFVKYISSSQQKGLAWTFSTLEEGSLEYYLSSLLQDSKTLNQHYTEQSLLRDTALSQRVVTAINTLRAEALAIQAAMESCVTSDQQPSLCSPVDSGVTVSSDGSTENEEYFKGQQLNMSESNVETEVSLSSEKTLAEDCTNGNCKPYEPTTYYKTKPSIIAQNKFDGVCRRPRKTKKSESGKRVSFHRDSSDDSENFVAMRQPSNINTFFVEGRYSWAGEDDSFFTKEKEKVRQVKSEIYERKGLASCVNIFESELGIEADCKSSTTTLDDAKYNIEIVCEKLSNVVKQSLGLKAKEKTEEEDNINVDLRTGVIKEKTPLKPPLITERLAPEGQEDSREYSEYERLLSIQQNSFTAIRSSVDLTSDSELSVDTPDGHVRRCLFRYPGSQRSTPRHPSWPTRVLHEAPSKTSLVKRFLHSIPTRKQYKVKELHPKPKLYIEGIKPDPVLAYDLLEILENEIKNLPPNKNEDDEVITDVMKIALQETVLLSKHEKIYKVYRVASTKGVPLLAVLTDTALYMTGPGADNTYCRRHHISYCTLDSIVIGPEYQTMMFVTVDLSVIVTVISAMGQPLVHHMVTHLALAVWRAAHVHLSVRQLSLTATFCPALLSQPCINKEDKLHYYRYIRMEDTFSTGPHFLTRCGHLMYRPHSHSAWLPGYVLLRGGSLYVFGDASQQSPKHILSLHRGYFGGCRRVFNSNRPHAFEILPFGQRGFVGTFQFAAADDYECSDWLQAFIQTSSDLTQSTRAHEEPLISCGLLLTSHHLVTLDYPDKVMSCARLQDISAIRTTSTACILETSCREVQETGGDWILYFLTDHAISEFLDALYLLRPEINKGLLDVWESKELKTHCLQTSRLVRSAWDPLLRPSCVKQCAQ